MASLLDSKPVEGLQVLGDVDSLGQVEDQSGSCVLVHLESFHKFGGGTCIECIAVVQPALVGEWEQLNGTVVMGSAEGFLREKSHRCVFQGVWKGGCALMEA